MEIWIETWFHIFRKWSELGRIKGSQKFPKILKIELWCALAVCWEAWHPNFVLNTCWERFGGFWKRLEVNVNLNRLGRFLRRLEGGLEALWMSPASFQGVLGTFLRRFFSNLPRTLAKIENY